MVRAMLRSERTPSTVSVTVRALGLAIQESSGSSVIVSVELSTATTCQGPPVT